MKVAPQVILHHDPNSPFAEKVRLILGLKRMDSASVHIPAIMAKPDVAALTGGYRKTPMLQLGAPAHFIVHFPRVGFELRRAA
jgi:glutathione S-transferase